MHLVQEETSISADAKYQQCLENAPHLIVWAEANPAAAAKFKSCPFDFYCSFAGKLQFFDSGRKEDDLTVFLLFFLNTMRLQLI